MGNTFYFNNSGNTSLTVKADDFLYATQVGAAGVHVYFDVASSSLGTLSTDTDNNATQAWQTKRKLVVALTIDTTNYSVKTFMKNLIVAANEPVSVGDPRAKYDRGFIVVGDDANSEYLTGVSSVDNIYYDSGETSAIV
tara:strand:+ start:886 stop:1302 length:417 start_codon:yes stop_codon:yes gene_type:complete